MISPEMMLTSTGVAKTRGQGMGMAGDGHCRDEGTRDGHGGDRRGGDGRGGDGRSGDGHGQNKTTTDRHPGDGHCEHKICEYKRMRPDHEKRDRDSGDSIRHGMESTVQDRFDARGVIGIRGAGDEVEAKRHGRGWLTPWLVEPPGWGGVDTSPSMRCSQGGRMEARWAWLVHARLR